MSADKTSDKTCQTPPSGASFDSAHDLPAPSSKFFHLAMILLAAILTIIAYKPVLFDFFLGDDFVHLTWLKDAVHSPDLVWRNFYTSWLDGTTTRFYRPLISVFMVSDYMIWGPNGFGFHLTNLIFHLIGTIATYLVAVELILSTRNAKEDSVPAPMDKFYGLASALIFGLYPLHPEAVSWITGRVDAVVSAFYMSALFSFIRWRKSAGQNKESADSSASATRKKTSSWLWLTSTLLLMFLGLLSKEMAITLPALFFAYAFLFEKRDNEKDSTIAHWSKINSAWQSLKTTIPFWILLAAYFALRRYALGTFVGGYDDSLFFIADIKHFLLSWVHGLRMFLVPLNKNLLGAHHILTRLWEIHIALVVVLLLINLYSDRKLIRLFIFNCFFILLGLAPVYKIFAIADDLQASRLAHVASLALSLLIAMCFLAPKPKASDAPVKLTMRMISSIYPRAILLVSSTALLACVLWINNQAWAKAGMEANAIRAGLSELYRKIEGDPQVLLIGLPDQIDGAYISRNAIWGMTKAPQLERDISNCLMLNQFEQILPFGFLKTSLMQAAKDVHVFYWDSQAKKFREIALDEVLPETRHGIAWLGSALKEIVQVECAAESRFEEDGSLVVKGSADRHRGKPEILIDLGKRNCFYIDFLSIDIEDLGSVQSRLAAEGADLLYTNDVRREFNLPDRTHTEFKADTSRQRLILPLRALPEWALGGKSDKLKLRLPAESHLRIRSIELVPPELVMPEVSFENSGYMGSKGFIHLSDDKQPVAIQASARNIPGAQSLVLEISRANLYFELQNCISPSKVQMIELPFKEDGSLILERKLFPAAGIYEARPWALDNAGRRVGVAGDHIVISCDS